MLLIGAPRRCRPSYVELLAPGCNVGPHNAGDLTRRRRPLHGDAVSCRIAAAAARVVAGTYPIVVGAISLAAVRLADAACLNRTPAPTAGLDRKSTRLNSSH